MRTPSEHDNDLRSSQGPSRQRHLEVKTQAGVHVSPLQKRAQSPDEIPAGASQGPPSLHSEPRPKETDQRALPYHVRTSLPKDLISEMAAKGVPRQDARE